MNSTKIKNYFTVVTPSITGMVVYTLVSGLVIFLHQFSSLQHYLQVPGDVNFVRMFTSWLDRTITGNFGESVAATLVVGIFWALVGVSVYLVLKGLARSINEFSEGLDQRKYLWPKGVSRNHALVVALQRIALRIAAFLGFIYLLFGPLMRLLNGPTGGHALPLSWVMWFVLLWLVLHICVVLLRLMTLKPRLLS